MNKEHCLLTLLSDSFWPDIFFSVARFAIYTHWQSAICEKMRYWVQAEKQRFYLYRSESLSEFIRNTIFEKSLNLRFANSFRVFSRVLCDWLARIGNSSGAQINHSPRLLSPSALVKTFFTFCMFLTA